LVHLFIILRSFITLNIYVMISITRKFNFITSANNVRM
jgi:hypothetical protein